MLTIIFLMLFTLRTYGQPSDPQNLLPQVRAFLGDRNFQDSFHCGDTANIDVYRISCEYGRVDGGTTQTCTDISDPKGVRVTRSVYNCTPQSISFLIDLTGDSTDLTDVQFEAAHNNVAEIFLAQAGPFSGYAAAIATLTKVESTTFTLGRTSGHPYSVPALNISGDLGEPGFESYPYLITVIQNVPGVAQLVRFRMNGTTWFKVDGFTVPIGGDLK